MSGHDGNIGKKSMMEAYYKMIGEAHVENIVDELAGKSDEIDKIVVPKSMDDWFDSFQKRRKQEVNRKRWLRRMRKLSARAAVFAVILVASMTVVTLSVDAFRIRVFNFFLEKNESFSEIEFAENETNQEVPDIKLDSYYYLAYLPSGYQYEKYTVVGDGITIEYTNGKDIITFDQDKSGAYYQLDTEDSEVHEVVIGEKSGRLIIKEERAMLFWTDGENSFLIIGLLAEQEIIKMANSIEKN